MKIKEPNEIIQWSYDFIQSFYLNNSETQTDTERMYAHYLAPFAEKYYSPLNPFLIFGGADISHLMKKDVWLLRDGLIPLSFFFKDAPLDLMDGQRKFLVHKDFWFLIPPEWQKSVLFYDMIPSTFFGNGIVPEKMVLTGIANDTLADIDEFVQAITDLAAAFTEKEIKSMQIIAYFPNKRADLWGKWQDENIFKYAKLIFKNLKLDIEFPEWDILQSSMDYQNTLYYEINSGAIVKDTSVQQMFLSRGAGLLKKKNETTSFKMIKKHQISLYHNVEIYEFDFKNSLPYENPLKDDLMPYFKKIIEKGTAPRVLSEGWEKWYGTYIKKYYKARKII